MSSKEPIFPWLTSTVCQIPSISKRSGLIFKFSSFKLPENNPTCRSFSEGDLLSLITEFPTTYFIVDEAYVEFSQHKSICNHINGLKNAVATRTFSKLYGLAGVRLGYLCCNAAFFEHCVEFHNPKEVTTIALDAGNRVFENHAYYENVVEECAVSKARCCAVLIVTSNFAPPFWV